MGPSEFTKSKASQRVPIRLIAARVNGDANSSSGEPITMGVPFPRGLCIDETPLRIWSGSAPLPTQVRVLDRWVDGSIRWALLDWQTCDAGVVNPDYSIEIGGETAPTSEAVRLCSRVVDDRIYVDTCAAIFQLQPGERLFKDVTVNGRPVIDPAATRLNVTFDNGHRAVVRFDRFSVEEAGSIRCVVRGDGVVGPKFGHQLEITLRIHFFAGSTTIRIAVTLRNPRRAQHPGGIWQLGDAGSVLLQDVSAELTMANGSRSFACGCSPEPEQPTRGVDLPFELYQDSSGGENWTSPNHRNREGRVPLSFRGYRMSAGDSGSVGLRATPIVSLRADEASLAVAVPAFWQNFPKAVEAVEGVVIVRLFPKQFDDVHELQGGEQKTHTFYVAFDSVPHPATSLEWCRTPRVPILPPAWYAFAQAARYIFPDSENANTEHQALIDAAIEGPRSFVRKREIVDEYGWRNFGELFADHEGVFEGDRIVVSHYNNQYDAVAAFANHFMRTGDLRWWELMDDLAHHVADIDIYHTDQDKSAYNHGLFWHTAHYLDAGLSTHRTYPKSPKVCGGGPSNEHNYASGLMLHHFLTGDPISREMAIGLARWVVDMDDGRKTIFRWLTPALTGLASQTGHSIYQGPGRGAGHSVRALLDGHRLTGDAALLAKAEEIIRRVIHPADDVPARDLLDAEPRWSYTAFLQALGVYLDYKIDIDQRDATYAYARATLLHYARWMADHEYPYLDKPEILEFPNETWAAQDLRKADVFRYAARHAEGAERGRFEERAAFFFDDAVARLRALPTSSMTRPTILALTNGLLEAYARARPDLEPAPLPDVMPQFGEPVSFTPQKLRAKRRLVALAVAILCLSAAGSCAWRDLTSTPRPLITGQR